MLDYVEIGCTNPCLDAHVVERLQSPLGILDTVVVDIPIAKRPQLRMRFVERIGSASVQSESSEHVHKDIL